jgi:MFS family permease
VIAAAQRVLNGSLGFIRRQTHNFKVIVVRRSIQAVTMNLSTQYNAIYAQALGANAVQIGSIRSVGNAVGALASLPTGWLIDRSSPRGVFLIGTALMGLSAILYLLARYWAFLYAGMILLMVGMRITCTSCTVSCAHELANKERATGRGFCRTLSSLFTLLTPMAAAWLVSLSGGLGARGLRPLYGIQALAYGGLFIFMAVLFRDGTEAQMPSSGSDGHGQDGEASTPGSSPPRAPHAARPRLAEIAVVFRQGPEVVRMMLMVAFMEVPWAMAQPFVPLFAHQIKGADEFVLGGIVTVRTLVPLFLSILLGRVADARGRKRVLLLLTPLFNLGYLALVFAPNRLALLASGLMFGFYSIAVALALAMASELVPRGQTGRWIGIVSLVRGLIGVPAPLLGGVIWKLAGPAYVFFFAVGLDVLVRFPLTLSLPETLNAGGYQE